MYKFGCVTIVMHSSEGRSNSTHVTVPDAGWVNSKPSSFWIHYPWDKPTIDVHEWDKLVKEYGILLKSRNKNLWVGGAVKKMDVPVIAHVRCFSCREITGHTHVVNLHSYIGLCTPCAERLMAFLAFVPEEVEQMECEGQVHIPKQSAWERFCGLFQSDKEHKYKVL